MRRVLAATDLSTHGGHAVPHAYSMLEAGGVVRLVHVIEPGEARDRCFARLRKLIPAEAKGLGLHTDVEVIENSDTAGGICDAADRFEADLICAGSHGHSGFLAGALSSVAPQ